MNLSLVTDSIIIWASNPKEFTKKLLEKIRKLNKVKYIPKVDAPVIALPDIDPREMKVWL